MTLIWSYLLRNCKYFFEQMCCVDM